MNIHDKIHNIIMKTMSTLGIFGAGMVTAAMIAYQTVCLPLIGGLVIALTLAILATFNEV